MDIINAYPIWGLVEYEGEPLSYSYIISDPNMPYLLPLEKSNDYILLEIEKDEKDVLLTDFYNWVDVLYYYKDADDNEREEMKSYGANTLAHALNLREDCTLQAIMKNIKKEDVKNTYDLSSYEIIK